ncbi:hypothetical protein ACFFRR_009461 [Megaselia abdita]
MIPFLETDMTQFLSGLCLALCLSTISVYGAPAAEVAEDGLQLTILHNNDMHARFEQVSMSSGTCTPDLAEANKCYGGFARIAHLVRKYRKESEETGVPFLFINAGDTYTGTPWFTVYKDEIATKFVNLLKPDVISLGNHEFDEGIEGLVPFVKNASMPVLAANLDFSKVPQLKNISSLKPSEVLTLNGTKVGIIGYLTPDTQAMATTGGVVFLPEVESINAEAKKLKSEGVKIIIALGHSGYKQDQIIAKECPDVDIVVGGHSHSFLYTGSKPPNGQPETIEGPYPTFVEQKSGKHVPVVQAYAFTKYLGKIEVKFDIDGNIKEFNGAPILLDNNIPREADILDLLNVYRPKIEELATAVVGHTRVHLDGSSCRDKECNMGNLITESMVYHRVRLLDEQNNTGYWTDSSIAFLQGGGIRASIDKSIDGNITMKDVLTVLPFEDKFLLLEVYGKTIRNALEHSAKVYKTDSSGGFLQMHGIRVEYNIKNPVGKRVTSVHVLCAECDIPDFSPLNDEKKYKLITSNFLYDGGDNHNFKDDGVAAPIELPKLDYEIFSQFLLSRSVVYPELDERITFKSSATSILISVWTLVSVFVLSRVI